MRTQCPCTKCNSALLLRGTRMETQVLKMLIPAPPDHVSSAMLQKPIPISSAVLTETFQRGSQPLPTLLFLTSPHHHSSV